MLKVVGSGRRKGVSETQPLSRRLPSSNNLCYLEIFLAQIERAARDILVVARRWRGSEAGFE